VNGVADDVRLQVSEDGADPERIDQLARRLRDELLQLDVDDVRPLEAGPAPDGSRAFDVLAVGGMLVTVGRSAGSLLTVVSAIGRWLGRGAGPPRTVRLELNGDVLELSSASAADQERLVALFVSRHAPAPS
jgi:hypothetical protein